MNFDFGRVALFVFFFVVPVVGIALGLRSPSAEEIPSWPSSRYIPILSPTPEGPVRARGDEPAPRRWLIIDAGFELLSDSEVPEQQTEIARGLGMSFAVP